MRAYHDSRDLRYREPFGAVATGSAVSLSIDIWDGRAESCALRLWVDGDGETLVPMSRREGGFECTFTPEKPALYWYSFVITAEGGVLRYGACDGRTGGEGRLCDWEPPSFQLTVYEPRHVPDWYKNAIVYQIFPDRFARGADFRELAESALDAPRRGPRRRLVEDWDSTPFYEKDGRGRVTCWDFYGGTLSGIREKLGYLRQLGITALYLNPIFEAASCHRYDTGDYMKTDSMLGGDGAFESLAEEAAKYGISIILDGVFNHTGCDSRYFNKYGNYPDAGAYGSADSPYRSWFRFDGSPAGYDCWWGVDDLPNVEESDESYRDFIYGGTNSVVKRWLRAGAKGWRLDVADELPDDFIEGIKSAVVETLGGEGLLMGEVWEDASNKISYGKLRRYLLGRELDCAMNYPLLDALHGFLLGSVTAESLCGTLMTLKENYPPEAFYSALNLMGSHDRPRIMTVMGGAPDPAGLSEAERRDFRLSEGQRGLAKGRIWLMLLVQMAMPGVPCVYYGDEAGLEGYADPYNRAPFPWGGIDRDTAAMYRNTISLRRMLRVLTDGDFEPFSQGEDVFGFYRSSESERVAVMVNRSLNKTYTVTAELRGETGVTELVGGFDVKLADGRAAVTLRPLGSAMLYFSKKKRLAAPLARGAGVLCHITSVPNGGKSGDIGGSARRFVDFLAAAGQRYWQILPLNPTDAFGSPYAGSSALAANIGLLPVGERELREEYARFTPDAEYEEFTEKNGAWLTPYSFFTALKLRFGGAPWRSWPERFRSFGGSLFDDAELCAEAEFWRFCQYKFDIMWRELRDYAHEKGIFIIGDLPIYVSDDSADVWAEPEMFMLTPDGEKTDVAGVPPDYFAEEGQLWGNPLYDWEHMRADGYGWWLRRLGRAFELYDVTRLDHFRGFESFWAVPAGGRARDGRWLYGSGKELFEAAYERFGALPVIAEDLGSVTPAVRTLLAQCGICGTDVMQFYDGDPMRGYEPPEGKVAYTGTHDNRTLVGWCGSRYPNLEPRKAAEALIGRLMDCRADVVIMPLQDVLGLDDGARMNTPGTTEKNWAWQARADGLDDAAARLRKYTKDAGRL